MTIGDYFRSLDLNQYMTFLSSVPDNELTNAVMNGSDLISIRYIRHLYEAVSLETEERFLNSVYDFVVGSHSKDHPDALYFDAQKGLFYEKTKNKEKSEMHYKKAYNGFSIINGPFHGDTLDALRGLASFYIGSNASYKAEALIFPAYQALRNHFGAAHEETLRMQYWLARVYHWKGDTDEAEQCYDKCLRFSERILGVGHDLTQDLIRYYGMLIAELELPKKKVKRAYDFHLKYIRKVEKGTLYSDLIFALRGLRRQRKKYAEVN